MMKSKQAIFIVSIVGIIILVIGLGFLANRAAGPSKYDDFAKALKSSGSEFFGAFWCPHCQAQKAEFGSAKQYLPYVECSTADRKTTQICIDNKIESFPSWRFKDGITLTSVDKNPIVCAASPTGESIKGEPDICAHVHSEYARTWIFSDYKFSIKSEKDPVVTGNMWKFDSKSFATGEIPLGFLADQIKFTLPQ
jgi:hypothetical protein